MHRRSVTLDSPKRRLTVVDTVDTTAKIAKILLCLPLMRTVALTWSCDRAEVRDCHNPPALAADLTNGLKRLRWLGCAGLAPSC
jgi:hypothetical protein